MMRAQLKKRRPLNGARRRTRWVWIVRYPNTNGESSQCDRVGYFCAPGDSWRPRAYNGRDLPRLTEREARDKLREYENKVAAGRQDKPDPTSWDAFAEQYIADTRQTVRESSLYIIELSLAKFGESCEPKSPREVDRAMVKRFVQKQRDAGQANATVAKSLASLKRVWNDAFRGTDNPFVGVAKLKSAARDWHYYSPDEIGALLSRAPCGRRRALYLAAYGTALRKNELANLTWADVDLDAMTIGVNPMKDTATTWAWVAKGTDRRDVPMTANVKLAILRLRHLPDASPYVFIPADRHARIIELRDAGRWTYRQQPLNNLLRDWKVDCGRAGLHVGEFHALRKSCVTNWLTDGIPPHEVQRWAGHADITTTMKYYAKLDTTAMDRARKATENRLAGLVA